MDIVIDVTNCDRVVAHSFTFIHMLIAALQRPFVRTEGCHQGRRKADIRVLPEGPLPEPVVSPGFSWLATQVTEDVTT